jgi:hypothetical protein
MADCQDTHRNEPRAIASARKGANAALITQQQTIEMDQSPEQAKDNARAMKLPAISYGHYEGKNLLADHVYNVLMLSGIDQTTTCKD